MELTPKNGAAHCPTLAQTFPNIVMGNDSGRCPRRPIRQGEVHDHFYPQHPRDSGYLRLWRGWQYERAAAARHTVRRRATGSRRHALRAHPKNEKSGGAPRPGIYRSGGVGAPEAKRSTWPDDRIGRRIRCSRSLVWAISDWLCRFWVGGRANESRKVAKSRGIWRIFGQGYALGSE